MGITATDDRFAIAVTPMGNQLKLERVLFETTTPDERRRGEHSFQWAWIEVDETE